MERGSVTAGLIAEGGGFSVSVLSRADRAVVRRFVKPVTEVETDAAGVAISMQGEPVARGRRRPAVPPLPRWPGCSCQVRHCRRGAADGVPPEASHILFVGEVVDAGEADCLPTARAPRPEVLRMEDTRMNYGG